MHDNLLDVAPEAPPDSAPAPPEQAVPRLPDRAAPSRPLPVLAQALPAAEPGTDAPRSWPRLPRLLQWRHTQPRSPDADPPIAAAGGPAPAVPAQTGPPKLILMLLYGDADPDERSSWRRGRSLMLRVDEGLAAACPGAFKVRALSGKGGSARTPSGRQDASRRVTSDDRTRALSSGCVSATCIRSCTRTAPPSVTSPMPIPARRSW